MTMLKTRTIVLLAAAVCLGANGALAAGDQAHIERHEWSFGGMFGQYDKNQLQRGFQVYREVCSSCHSITRIAFRNLAQPGGPEFPEEAVKALAREYEVNQPPNDEGEVVKGPAKLSDRFPALYANDNAARAIHNGALPPDLSVIAKARGLHYEGPWYLHPWSMAKDIVTSFQEGGADYLVGLMKGYKPVPSYKRDDKGHYVPVAETSGPGVEQCVSITHGEDGRPDQCNKLAEGMNYNAAFPGHQIAMINPFAAHSKDSPQVTYQDGTPQTVEQYAKDIAAFLSWASDPTLNERKQLGWMVIFYLLITTILLYIAKRRVWSGVAH
jgi:ubiquinol-cytochrome c reductase cytochrome c1 subunit